MIICRSQRSVARFGIALAVALIFSLLAEVKAQMPSRVPPADARPSIILIVADDLGYGDLGCYGQTQIKTPNIDALASEGIRFTSFYAGNAICASSHASFLLGKHTGHMRIRGDKGISLQADDLTVAEILKTAGYSTGALGEWGLGGANSPGIPGNKGFDEWFGYLTEAEAHNYYPQFLNRSGSQGTADVMVSENSASRKENYSCDYFTRAAMNFIRINQPNWINNWRPYFLYLPYTIVHANNELGAKTGNGMQVPEDAPYGNEVWPQPEKNKAAMISRLDRYVGSVMEKLKELKMDSNTIVIFTSDNGPHKEGGVDPKYLKSAGALRGIKRDLYEGGIRVPFIVRWPGKIHGGAISDMPCAAWDFLPTACDFARIPPPPQTDGISLATTLSGYAQTNRHEFLYWEFHEDGFKQAVRMGDWKGLRFGSDGPLELYNLKTDLGERFNVADANPKIVAKIQEYLKTARTDDNNWPAKPASETPKKEYGK